MKSMSGSKLEHLEQKLRHQAKSKDNLVYPNMNLIGATYTRASKLSSYAS